MVELLRTDDPELLSLATSVLTDAHVDHHIADGFAVGAELPRLLVAGELLDAALSLLTDAGVLD